VSIVTVAGAGPVNSSVAFLLSAGAGLLKKFKAPALLVVVPVPALESPPKLIEVVVVQLDPSYKEH
jgi:hypothetical protein